MKSLAKHFGLGVWP